MPRLPRLLRQLPRPELSYANIASTAALVLALGTGTAYAANTIASEDIIDGEVKNADLATNAVHTGKIKNGGVWAPDVKEGVLTGVHVADGGLGSADLGFDSVGSSEIQTDAVGQTELAANTVESDEVVNSSLTGSDVANDGLTMADIAGGGTSNGSVSFNALANGRCFEVSMAINGGTAGDAVVITTKDDMPNGVFLYGTEVPAPGTAKAVICNLSGATSPEINDMPVRIHTFH